MGTAGTDNSAGNESEKGNAAKPQHGPSHRLLEAFVGQWKVEGSNRDQTSMSGLETYSWMEGEYFLSYEWSRESGPSVHAGKGILAFDSKEETYLWRQFDNLGFYRKYTAEIEKDFIQLKGEKERAKIALNAAEDQMSIDWEYKGDDEKWKPLCHLKGRKIH